MKAKGNESTLLQRYGEEDGAIIIHLYCPLPTPHPLLPNIELRWMKGSSILGIYFITTKALDIHRRRPDQIKSMYWNYLLASNTKVSSRANELILNRVNTGI